jgi:uncharacterized protein
MMLGWDPNYWLFVGPAILLAGLATILVRSTFARYAKSGVSSGLTGAEAAQAMLASEGVHDVRIEAVNGLLTDHYDPSANVLRLSEGVYGSRSLAAIGVACHEAGHALQQAHGYLPLHMRSALVPITQFGSSLSWPIIFIGFLLRTPFLVKIGVILFGAAVVFSLVTLPVEWNASARAKKAMVAAGIVQPQEAVHAGRVLNAAFLTYVASAFTAIMTLLYYLTLGSRSRN